MEIKQVPPANPTETLFLRVLFHTHVGAVEAVAHKLGLSLTSDSSPEQIALAVQDSLVSAFLVGALLALRASNDASVELIKELVENKGSTTPKESMN